MILIFRVLQNVHAFIRPHQPKLVGEEVEGVIDIKLEFKHYRVVEWDQCNGKGDFLSFKVCYSHAAVRCENGPRFQSR